MHTQPASQQPREQIHRVHRLKYQRIHRQVSFTWLLCWLPAQKYKWMELPFVFPSTFCCIWRIFSQGNGQPTICFLCAARSYRLFQTRSRAFATGYCGAAVLIPVMLLVIICTSTTRQCNGLLFLVGGRCVSIGICFPYSTAGWLAGGWFHLIHSLIVLFQLQYYYSQIDMCLR